MSDVHEQILGGLAESYEQYKSILANTDPDETRAIPLSPEVRADKVKAVLEKLKPTVTPEEVVAALEKTKYAEVSVRQSELSSNGFGGTITRLFDRIIEIDPITDEANVPVDIIEEIAAYNHLPEDIRTRVKMQYDLKRYYYGGVSHLVPVE